MAVAASRFLRSSKPLQFESFSSSSSSHLPSLQVSSTTFQLKEKKRKVVLAMASVSENVVLERETKGRAGDLASVAADVADAVLGTFKPAKRKSWPLQAQMIFETGILNCRFFTLFAVAGSLIGSILCFVEGCFLILESFYEYFHHMSQRSDQGEVMQLLVEALDLFLVGNAMLIFGVGIYVLFVGSKEMKRGHGHLIHGSNFFGLFPLTRVPSWADMQSLSQAKTRIGHAVVMILQAGVLEKLKSVAVVNALDLACFAGAILLSSACIFLLSKLSLNPKECEKR